MVSRFQLR
jgi:hypothetical protein